MALMIHCACSRIVMSPAAGCALLGAIVAAFLGGCVATVTPEVRVANVAIGERTDEGVVLNFEGDGEHARVQVNFRDSGTKWLVLAYANLSPVA